MRCFNCNSPYHKGYQCTKPSRSSNNSSTCHNCKQTGHKVADCPNAASRGSGSGSASVGSTCHKCKQPGHKMAECPLNVFSVPSSAPASLPPQRSSQPSQLSSPQLPQQSLHDLPVVPIVVILNGMWGRNSCLVSDNCALTDLKRRLVEEFCEMVDSQNATAHINIDGNQEIYNKINGVDILLRFSHLRVNRDYIDISVGFGKHFTLVYSKGIRDAENLSTRLRKVWTEWAESLLGIEDGDEDDEGRGEGEEKKEETKIIRITEIDDTCAVCMDAKRDCLIDCPHFIMCMECAKKMTTCPVCRQAITLRMKKMIRM